MKYCTLDDVKELLKSMTITHTSKVTAEEVGKLIDERTRWINSRVVRQYSLPVTDVDALPILRAICRKAVAGDVLRTIYAGTLKNVPEVAKDWIKEAKEDLENIANGTMNIDSSEKIGVVQTGTLDSNGDTRVPKVTIDQEF